ncbi:MAG: hypothetical protein IPO56_17565 [Flavobacteriales bacterium]|nr:hypothetical protein [Flavobacteriales bacterium]
MPQHGKTDDTDRNEHTPQGSKADVEEDRKQQHRDGEEEDQLPLHFLDVPELAMDPPTHADPWDCTRSNDLFDHVHQRIAAFLAQAGLHLKDHQHGPTIVREEPRTDPLVLPDPGGIRW